MPQEDSVASVVSNPRVVGIDVRPHSFAFIVLEGARVLDFGSRTSNRSDPRDSLGRRLRRILDNYQPQTVVMRKRGARRIAYKERYSNAASLRQVCVDSKAVVVEVGPRAVRRHFKVENAWTKYEIAYAVASFLPELGWKLPPQRKSWQGEHHRMAIFDAAAVALTHLKWTSRPSTQLA